ncbi:aldose epimerase family protein [Danxiaibacter flavus]|uniref:Aldose 1-epimerase n=1 Tax=Danxiaibacter flavus TaxID=3049108 RepID=A0ABV3ZLS7_9BACT|nr:aldose epimerase family protein [Chitinophagaceae bacterium DXS]
MIEAANTTKTFSAKLKSAGDNIHNITLQNGALTIEITNIGCSIKAIHMPDKAGKNANIVAGFTESSKYLDNPYYFGSVIGRYANRISKGKFSINGTEYRLSVNNPPNHLHGGFDGFNKKKWEVVSLTQTDSEAGVIFEYNSADGEEGYPGKLVMRVEYLLNSNNELSMLYTAKTDQKTPVNITNHSYFNLSGFENDDITDHLLEIYSSAFSEKGTNNLPTGNLLPVRGTPLDFTEKKSLGKDIDLLADDKGYDHNFVVKIIPTEDMQKVAVLKHTASGRQLSVITDQPGLQLYTANWWDGSLIGYHNKPYKQHGAVALETQFFPDSPNQPAFPNTILSPGDKYKAKTIYAFSVNE